MERLSTQSATQDASIALCYQLNQPLNVQSVDPQTAVAVQSLLDSQVITETQEEEEDIFQCGKCKKQFTSLATFVGHKQMQCMVQQQMALQPQHSQLTLGTGPSAFAPTINLNRPFSQTQINGAVPTINTNPPILQAHPCLTRSLNQPSNAPTLTLGGVPSSPISQLSQNMVFTDDLMTLTNLDSGTLGGQTIQMVTGPLPGQTVNNSNGVAIFSPITSLATNQNTFTPTAGPTNQLLVQSGQHITLAAITDKTVQQAQQLQQQQQPVQQQQLTQTMPPPPAPPQAAATITVTQSAQQHIQPQIFKPSPTKAGRRSAQSNFITVLNDHSASLNSTSLLSTRKGKTARGAKNNTEVVEEDANSKPKLKCEYCNKQFSKNFDLQQHVRAHTGEKPFQCIVCGRAFAQKSNVKKHMATHKVWPCGTSNTLPKQPEGEIVENENDPNQTQSSAETNVSATVPIALPSAPLGTANQQAQQLLKSTVEQLKSSNEEKEDEDLPKMKVVVDNSYICQYCPAKFKTYYQLKTHLVHHKGEQVYKCVMKNCGLTYHDLDTFLEHVKSHENEMSYRCHQCHKYFKSLYDLGVHQYSHIYMSQGVKSGPRHFQCTKCGNKYTTPEALEHHMSTTSHDYKCPHCNKQFTCERFLRRHLPIHGSEGQFECQQCKKRFKTEHYLKSHILIHTGETPYACEICQAAFNRKDKLKRHMTIHDAVKKYRCPFRSIAGCTKEFNRPDKLKAHIITHSGFKPYKCSICGKGFSRRPHLVEHERGHNMDYRFKCDKCGKGFFRPKLFNEHKCQPNKSGPEQQFRPRNRRKIGRPKKRMISIAPDSVSKSRGKQYPSRTRTKSKIMQFPNQIAPTQTVSVKQRLRQQQQQKQLIAKKKAALEQRNDKLKNDAPNTLSVEVVKALPVITPSGKAGDRLQTDNGSNMNIHIPGLVDGKEVAGDSLGPHVQQISLGPGGELVDHYVVHLTESVDGSGPTIQTAFIPAVSGGQIFASTPDGMGIQPIAIIEARSFNMGTPEASGAQVLAADGGNAIISSSQNQIQGGITGQGSSTVNGDSYITVAEGTHIVGDNGRDAKSDLSNTAMIMLSGNGANDCEGSGMIASHGGDVMVSGQGVSISDHGVVTNSNGLSGVDVKEEAVMVIGNHNMMVTANEMVSGDTENGTDIMDSSLSLFAPPTSGDGYVGGQVVVSGDQTYITCSTHLVDYSNADTVLQGSS